MADKDKKKDDNRPKLPDFLGIDVGASDTKVAQVQWDGNNPKLIDAFSFKTGQYDLRADDASARTSLSTTIKDAVKGSKNSTKKAVIALPEPVVFNRLLTFPNLAEAELNEAIHWNAKQFIPIPIDEVQMDWIKTGEVQQDGKSMVQLLIVAAPKRTIENAVKIFDEAGLELIAIETEAVASARAISHAYRDNVPVMVADIGAAGTDLSVLVNGKLIFSQSLATGSDAMDKALISQFKVDTTQAEQYKSKTGLTQEGDGQIAMTLAPVAKVILDEITKTINYFRSKYQQSTPQRVMLIGSGSKLPGLPQYLSQGLGIEVKQADLSQNLAIDSKVSSDIGGAGLLTYGVALGLALKQE